MAEARAVSTIWVQTFLGVTCATGLRQVHFVVSHLQLHIAEIESTNVGVIEAIHGSGSSSGSGAYSNSSSNSNRWSQWRSADIWKATTQLARVVRDHCLMKCFCSQHLRPKKSKSHASCVRTKRCRLTTRTAGAELVLIKSVRPPPPPEILFVFGFGSSPLFVDFWPSTIAWRAVFQNKKQKKKKSQVLFDNVEIEAEQVATLDPAFFSPRVLNPSLHRTMAMVAFTGADRRRSEV